MKQKITCNLSECVNNTKDGFCDEFLPTIIPKLKPNDKSCYHFETEDYKIHHYENLKNRLKFEAEELEASEKEKKNGRKN